MDDEKQFARALAHPDKTVRDKTVNELKKYLSSLKDITDIDMLKLWKALFYCLWLADKGIVQLELSETLANLIHSFSKASLAYDKYLTMFFRTMMREWHHLDQYRLNKFYSLIRFMIRQALIRLRDAKWNKKQVTMFVEALSNEVLTKHPNGPRYHMCDIYISELHTATEGDLSTDQFLFLLSPFFKSLGCADDAVYHTRVCSKVFTTFINSYSREQAQVAANSMNGDGDESNAPTVFDKVSSVKLQQALFDIASSDDNEVCHDRHRRKIYALHSELQRVTKVQIADDDAVAKDLAQIDPATSSDSSSAPSSTKKKGKKTKRSEVEEEIEVSTPAVPETAEKKKSKKSKRTEGEVENNEVSTPAIPETSEKKKLKKKKLDEVTEVGISNHDAKVTKEVKKEVKVSVKDDVTSTVQQSAPQKFIASSKFAGAKSGYVFKKGPKGIGYYIDKYAKSTAVTATTPAKGNKRKAETPLSAEKQDGGAQSKKKKSKKAKTVEVEVAETDSDENRRVRFGELYAKEYRESVQGLKTASPDLRITPAKSAIKTKKPVSTSKSSTSKKSRK
mmetsp:Transcript_23927/g.35125  ORF Transcript_23927/g.35125 Transcript_23927/m.35125 type:complete len:563 (+) Transcript_23927:79-1767(+)